MLIEDAKVKEIVYSGNTVIFLLPNRECMRENSFFWSPSQLIMVYWEQAYWPLCPYPSSVIVVSPYIGFMWGVYSLDA